MKKHYTVGVLAFHGDVTEHIHATEAAGKKLNIPLTVLPVRTKKDLTHLDGLILPGGESTTLQKLCEREDMLDAMRNMQFLFGTCAGAILLAKHVLHKAPGQKTLALADITIDRNAYGRQVDSFEADIDTHVGKIRAIFIRAPKIQEVGKNVRVLAKREHEIVACEEEQAGRYMLVSCFHPELTTTAFHEYFLARLDKRG